jgi:hypothetical protein
VIDVTETISQLAPTSTVAEAVAFLDRTGQFAVVVSERGEPVGVVTRVALRGQPGHRPRPAALLADVMDFEVIALDPASDTATTTGAYREAAWHSLRRRRPAADDTVARRRGAFSRASSPSTG